MSVPSVANTTEDWYFEQMKENVMYFKMQKEHYISNFHIINVSKC